MWPRAFWDRVYEPVIRNAAGLGVSPSEPDADRYASRFAHTDVLVVGAGPAGLAAALAAGRSGASVMLVDETAEPGGSLLSEPAVVIDGKPAWDWLGRRARRAGRAAERHGDDPHHRDRLLPPEPPRPRAAPHRPSRHRPRRRPARAALEGARRPGRPRPGRAGEAAGLRRQRPPRRHAGRRRPDLPQPLRRQGRRPPGRSSPPTTAPGTPPSTSPRPARSPPPSSTSAPRSTRPSPTAPAPSASRRCSAAPSPAPPAACG